MVDCLFLFCWPSVHADHAVWVILMIFMAQNGTWNVPDITNKASPRLSLIEKFAKIAVYK